MIRHWYRARTLESLGDAVAEIRRGAGLSQSEAAAMVNSSRPTVSRLERGFPVSTDTVLGILAAASYDVVLVPKGARIHVEDAS